MKVLLTCLLHLPTVLSVLPGHEITQPASQITPPNPQEASIPATKKAAAHRRFLEQPLDATQDGVTLHLAQGAAPAGVLPPATTIIGGVLDPTLTVTTWHQVDTQNLITGNKWRDIFALQWARLKQERTQGGDLSKPLLEPIYDVATRVVLGVNGDQEWTEALVSGDPLKVKVLSPTAGEDIRNWNNSGTTIRDVDVAEFKTLVELREYCIDEELRWGGFREELYNKTLKLKNITKNMGDTATAVGKELEQAQAKYQSAKDNETEAKVMITVAQGEYDKALEAKDKARISTAKNLLSKAELKEMRAKQALERTLKPLAEAQNKSNTTLFKLNKAVRDLKLTEEEYAIALAHRDVVFFYNTQGVFSWSDPDNTTKEDDSWREFIQEWDLKKGGQECIDKIHKDQADTCGVERIEKGVQECTIQEAGAQRCYNGAFNWGSHYLGNFWWAGCQYIARLPDPIQSHATKPRCLPTCSPEFWILSGIQGDMARAHSMHQSDAPYPDLHKFKPPKIEEVFSPPKKEGDK